MDLRQYYQAIQQVEKAIQENAVVVVSTATADGGKAGILSEVPRHIAARMVVEGKAMVATEEQTVNFALRRKGPTDDIDPRRTDSEASKPATHRSAVTRPRKR